jgi:hypothetical protein
MKKASLPIITLSSRPFTLIFGRKYHYLGKKYHYVEWSTLFLPFGGLCAIISKISTYISKLNNFPSANPSKIRSIPGDASF